MPELTVITPAFNEAENLDDLYAKLSSALAALDVTWEWIVVDDHSGDATFDVIRRLHARDPRVRGARFSRNTGSHAAITCGLHHARGRAAVALAADLQDPPETLGAMLAAWREGAQVVWAVRRQRPGASVPALGFARLYYWIMRNIVGMKEMPATGADFFLADRLVVDAFRQFRERHTSVLALVTWMGYRQAFVEYDKQARVRGRSGWTLRKKIKLVVDSVVSFSDAPVRACSYLGVGVLGLSALCLLLAIADVSVRHLTPGWMLLMAGVFLAGGLNLLMLGVLGEYLWRALDETRGRPPYLIEDATDPEILPRGRTAQPC